MKFFFDHDVPADVARVLKMRGHDVVQLREALPPDAPDREVWSHACAEGRIVISCNRAHFMQLAVATAEHPGLIVLVRRRTRQSEAAHLLALIEKAGTEGLVGNINFA